jgi:hypothetical protein
MARKKPEPAFTPLDVKGGDLTYGQRIEIGGILANPTGRSEYELFMDTMECLYGRKPKPSEFKEAIPLFKEAVEGIMFWVKAESEQLKYTPTQEEKDAGVERYAKEVGEIGTAYAIAKEFCLDPDVILGWKYGKVFGYLRKQKADGDFQRRYSEVMARKHKKK